MRKKPPAVPYGKTFALKRALENVECWNKSSDERYTLPVGTLLKVEHVNDATHTTCMAQDKHGKAPELFPGCYRWIVENQALGDAIGITMPNKTGDLVGDIIAYAIGDATPKQAKRLFTTLRKTGIGRKLQGHYSRRM